MLWVPLLLLIIAAVVDVRAREIPDAIPLALLGWAIALTASGVSPHGWMLLVLGLVTGLLFGAVVFWLGGFGGGDAKLLVALGATLGPQDFLVFMFYVAVAGGLLAIAALLRGKRDLAYAPIMTLGFAVFMTVRILEG
jgi:Flp pilus assembly protein protease CpaA